MSSFFSIISFPYAGYQLLDLNDEQDAVLKAIYRGERYDTPTTLSLVRLVPGAVMDVGSTPVGILVLTEKGKRVLTSLAGDDIQLLPATLQDSSDEYWVVNVLTRLKGAILKSEQIPVAAPAGEEISARGCILDPQVVGSHHIFVLPEMGNTFTCFTGDLAAALIAAKTIGPGLSNLDRKGEIVMPGEETGPS